MAVARATNTLFVRRLSSQVSEGFLRKIFSQCDEIEQILFKSFPGRSTEFYAQIDFKTSKGVVEGHKLSGTPFHGVPCEVSVMDPAMKDTMRSLEELREQQACTTLALRGQESQEAPAEPQGVQAEAIRRYRENAEDRRLRTVHVAGLGRGVEEEALRVLLTSTFGGVEKLHLDEDGHGDSFALVEFKDRGAATVAKMQQQIVVDGRVFAFSESKTLINTMEFAEETVHFSTPEAMLPPTWQAALALKENLTPKIAKARAAAAEIASQPLDEATREQLAIADGLKKAPEFQWAGRSEKEPLFPRRRHRSWGGGSRGSGSDSRDRRRDKKRKRQGSSKSASRGRSDLLGLFREAEKGTDGDDEGPPLNLEEDDGLDLAVVPNTEVLACSSQSSSEDEDDAPVAARREGKGASQKPPPNGEVASPSATGDSKPGAVAPEPDELMQSIDVPDNPPVPHEPIAVPDVPEPPSEPIAVPDLPPPPLHPIGLDDDEPAASAAQESRMPAAASAPVEAVAARADRAALGARAPVAPQQARAAAGPGMTSGGASGSRTPPAGALAAPEALPPAAAAAPTAQAAAQAGAPKQAAPDAPPNSRRARRLAAVRRAATLARLKAASSTESLGRWECPACGEVNKPTRELCNNCGFPAPWLGNISDDSGASSDRSASTGSGPKSVVGSPVRSVVESPAKSIAGSGSARSISDVPEMDVEDSGSGSEGSAQANQVAESEQASQKDDLRWEADVVRGEMADARARIFHAGADTD